MKRLLAVIAVLVGLGIGIQVLAEATMTRHAPVDPDSRLTVVVEADAKDYELATVQQMTEALVAVCELEVGGDPVPGSFEQLRPELFRFVLEPSPDAADRRQLHGCLEDARVDKLQLEVREMEVGSSDV